MNKKDLTEADICTKFITPALLGEKAGRWDVMTPVREEVYLTHQIEAFRNVDQGMGLPNLNTPIIAGWYFPLPPPRRTTPHRRQSRSTHGPGRSTGSPTHRLPRHRHQTPRRHHHRTHRRLNPMTTTPPLSPPMNHVLVDFENVHHIDPTIIGAKAVSLTILVGAKQTKLDAETVVKLFEHAASVQLIRLTASDKNAVDFALAYYLGRAVLADPAAYFHIVSKDSGYDPLIAHLVSRHVRVRRHEDFTTLSFAASPKAAPAVPKPAKAKAGPTAAKPAVAGPPDPMDLVLDRLRKDTTNRPKKKKTLLSHLKANLGKDASDADAIQLLEKLIKAGRIALDDKEGVSYEV